MAATGPRLSMSLCVILLILPGSSFAQDAPVGAEIEPAPEVAGPDTGTPAAETALTETPPAETPPTETPFAEPPVGASPRPPAAELDPRASSPHVALDLYRRDELSFSYTVRGYRVSRNGEDLGLSYFGTEAEEIFGGSEEALASMQRYRALRISGFVLGMAGVAALLAELVVLLTAQHVLIDRLTGDITPTFWAWLIPATVVGLGGGVLVQLSALPLFRAVQQYNADLYRQIREGRAPGTTMMGLTVRVRTNLL